MCLEISPTPDHNAFPQQISGNLLLAQPCSTIFFKDRPFSEIRVIKQVWPFLLHKFVLIFDHFDGNVFGKALFAAQPVSQIAGELVDHDQQQQKDDSRPNCRPAVKIPVKLFRFFLAQGLICGYIVRQCGIHSVCSHKISSFFAPLQAAVFYRYPAIFRECAQGAIPMLYSVRAVHLISFIL